MWKGSFVFLCQLSLVDIVNHFSGGINRLNEGQQIEVVFRED